MPLGGGRYSQGQTLHLGGPRTVWTRLEADIGPTRIVAIERGMRIVSALRD